MLYSAFALAVDRFVTLGRRSAQFCFHLLMRCLFFRLLLRPSGLLTRQLWDRIAYVARSSISSG